MDKEDLFISLKLVRVSFEFKNASKKEYKTVVAFPFPHYFPVPSDCDASLGTGCSEAGRIASLGATFKVRVDGKSKDFKLETKALVNGVDVTSLLKRYAINLDSRDIASAAIDKLSDTAKTELKNAGIIDVNWQLQQIAFWDQTFPANKLVRIEHDYRPEAGNSIRYELDRVKSEFCIDPTTLQEIQKKIKKLPKGGQSVLGYSYVDYILKSANTWIGPIRQFHLTIEKPKDSIVSLCLDGLTKTGPLRFELKLKNFTPSNDLHILFLGQHLL